MGSDDPSIRHNHFQILDFQRRIHSCAKPAHNNRKKRIEQTNWVHTARSQQTAIARRRRRDYRLQTHSDIWRLLFHTYVYMFVLLQEQFVSPNHEPPHASPPRRKQTIWIFK